MKNPISVGKKIYFRTLELEDDEYKNKGFGTKALVLLIKYGYLKLGMNRIYSGTIKDKLHP